jgi:adenylate cyclase
MERAYRAVLFVDVVESVRLIEQDEEEAISRWLEVLDYIEQSIVHDHDGRIVKRLGDGALLEFTNARSAVSAAFAIQGFSAGQNSDIPPDRQMLLRIGIEGSEVIVGRDDLYGRGVNMGARLMGLAGPGEIVISAHICEQLTPSLDADVEDLGDCYLKNVREPVRAFRVGPPGPRFPGKAHWPTSELRRCLAIIPFAAGGESSDEGLLGEIIADEMIQSISRSQELSVISRLSTMAFRQREINLESIRTHLLADYVVSGLCRSRGDQIVVDIELAEVGSARVVWSDRLIDRISAILAGEHELVDHAITRLSAALMTRELQRARSQPLRTLESCTLLLAAIALMHRLSPSDFNEARLMLEAIIGRASPARRRN